MLNTNYILFSQTNHAREEIKGSCVVLNERHFNLTQSSIFQTYLSMEPFQYDVNIFLELIFPRTQFGLF